MVPLLDIERATVWGHLTRICHGWLLATYRLNKLVGAPFTVLPRPIADGLQFEHWLGNASRGLVTLAQGLIESGQSPWDTSRGLATLGYRVYMDRTTCVCGGGSRNLLTARVTALTRHTYGGRLTYNGRTHRKQTTIYGTHPVM